MAGLLWGNTSPACCIEEQSWNVRVKSVGQARGLSEHMGTEIDLQNT